VGRLDRNCCPRPTLVRARDRARWGAATGRSAERGFDRGHAHRARRDCVLRRLGSRSGAVRGGAAPRDRRGAPGARPGGDGAPQRRAQTRHAGPCRVPRLSGAERRARRQSRPAPTGGARARAAQAHAGRMVGSRRKARAREQGGPAARQSRTGQVAPSPRLRANRRRPARDGVGRGRDRGGSRGSVEALRGRRALAPGRGGGHVAFQGTRRGSRAVPGKSATTATPGSGG
jgi:hypothetical protein